MRKETADAILRKTRDDYDAIAEDFSSTRNALWPELEAIKRLAKPGDRVLDAGCGNGRAYQLFEGMAIDYEGVDQSERLLGFAKERWRSPLVTFTKGSLLDLPLEDGSVDLALCIAALHHIPSRRYRLQALRELLRVLVPGGALFMTNWNRWAPKYAIE